MMGYRLLPTSTAGEPTIAALEEKDDGSIVEVEMEDIPQEGKPPSPKQMATLPSGGKKKARESVVVLERLPEDLNGVCETTEDEFCRYNQGFGEFIGPYYASRGRWNPSSQRRRITSTSRSKEATLSRTTKTELGTKQKSRTPKRDRAGDVRARLPSLQWTSSNPESEPARSRSPSPVAPGDLEKAAAARRMRGRPPTTGEYVGRAKAIERLAAAKERELRALREERSLQPGYVPPETQATRTLPQESEIAEQARDLTPLEIERRLRDSLEELERMVSVSSDLKGTYKRSMRMVAVKVKAYCSELLSRTGTGEDTQIGLLRSANEWLRKRLTACEGEVRALQEEIAVLGGGGDRRRASM